ncbi:hypothetical protein [Klenkia sp. PcliD-1-E]|uniref:hypothetical protein n=1 Tax=Klenkia sp. PcliD-1-E TaxID=2954492 RepID=UPI00209803EB|nr:hypothetical protein [Klenkia sp. PcliD-1-E]MCO7219981.1 hypothetical protein [Klenkia sp. PcliD-1-E]
MITRVARGRAEVVREIRAAAPLLAGPATPTTARGPWLAAALHAAPVPVPRVRHRAVVVDAHQQGRPDGAALLSSAPVLHRGRRVTVHRLLGDGGPPGPPGVAPRRLPAADADAAALLADGVVDMVLGTRGPWQLELTGLPLGDPVLAAVGARLGTGAVFRTTRSRALVDGLDDVGPVRRSTDPGELERWLPAFLAHRPARSRLADVRTLIRVHAAAGVLEHAVVPAGDGARAGLLTLLDGAARRPWFGFGPGLHDAPGQPWVSLVADSRGR